MSLNHLTSANDQAKYNLNIGCNSMTVLDNINMSNTSINNLADPVNPKDATNKEYVDNAVAQINPNLTCIAATTAGLNATYNNGTSGVGATLTNNGSLAALSLDGVSLSNNQLVLIKNMSTQAYNGVYVITNVGSVSVPWVLTRSIWFDTPSNITVSGLIAVLQGTVNAGSIFAQTNIVNTVGTDSINFVLFSNGSLYLLKSGGTMSGDINMGNNNITNANTVSANNINSGYTSTVSAGTTTILTSSSTRYQTLTGTLNQIYQLPDATTLSNGTSYYFNNNSSGNLTVTNNGTAPIISSASSGSYYVVFCVSNSTSNGSWDYHPWLPSNIKADTSGITISPGNLSVTSGTLNVGSTSQLAALTQTGTCNINNSGSATTNIAVSGTGAVNIGNSTGNISLAGQVTLNQSNNSSVPFLINSSGSGNHIFQVIDTDVTTKTFYVDEGCSVYCDGNLSTDGNLTVQSSGSNLYDATIGTNLIVDGNSTLGTVISGTWNGSNVSVSHGGTGDSSFTAYAPIIGGTTSTGALQSASTGISNSGYVLTSTGSSSAPTWQATASSGGPTWSTVTDSYTLPGIFISPSNNLNFSATDTNNQYVQCASSNGFVIYAPIYSDANAPILYVFTCSGGVLTYTSSLVPDYKYSIAKCFGNDVLVLSSDGVSNASLKHYTYSAGSLSLFHTIGTFATLQAYGLDMANPSGSNYLVSFAYQNVAGTQTLYTCYYWNGSTWSLCGNAPFTATNANVNSNFDKTVLIGTSTTSSTLPWQLGYCYQGNTFTIELRAITSGSPPSIANSITQTITQSNNSPSSVYNNWIQCQYFYDGTDPTYKFLHVVAPLSNGGGTSLGGAFRSYQYSSSTWSDVLDWNCNNINGGVSQSNDQFGFAQYSYDSNNNSCAFYNDTMIISSASGVLQQYTFTKGAGTLSVSYNGPELVPHGSRTTAHTINAVLTPDGTQLFSSINVATKYLISYLRGTAGTVNVVFQETSTNIREDTRLQCKNGSIFILPTTSFSQLPTAGTYGTGTTFIDSVSGNWYIYIGGTWKIITLS